MANASHIDRPSRKVISAIAGFSLIETVVAMSVLLVVLLGVTTAIVYTVNHNAGNNTRAQALTVLQLELERMRTAKFDPYSVDARLIGGVHSSRFHSTDDGGRFRIDVVIDDDPHTAGVQVDPSRALKEISLVVALERPTPGWQTALPAQTILRRVRSN